MTDRQGEEAERRRKGDQKRNKKKGGGLRGEREESQFVRSHVFLRLIITQIRSCFLLIRSAVSLGIFKAVDMHRQTHSAAVYGI